MVYKGVDAPAKNAKKRHTILRTYSLIDLDYLDTDLYRQHIIHLPCDTEEEASDWLTNGIPRYDAGHGKYWLKC